jgi:hypothetical protein
MSAPATPPTEEQAALGRQLGASIATELVEQIRGMGMPAAQAGPGTRPEINDIVFRGYLVSVEPGSAAKRMTIGFGSGGSELAPSPRVTGTANGLRKRPRSRCREWRAPWASLGAVGWLITATRGTHRWRRGENLWGGSGSPQRRPDQGDRQEFADLSKAFKEQGWIN